jgi:hypothetical protein
MSWAKDIGNQVSRAAKYGVDSFNAPNYIHWWVIPFVVSMFISLVITIYILHHISKSIKTTCLRLVDEEDNRDETCESTGLPFFVKLIVMLVAPILVSLIVSAGIYKIGVYTYNPKMAAGIATTGYIVDSFD